MVCEEDGGARGEGECGRLEPASGFSVPISVACVLHVALRVFNLALVVKATVTL